MATTCAKVSPEAKKPNSITINGFRISTQKLPILKADPIEEMTQKLGIAPPEMIFGDNYVAIEHEKGNWGINFNAFDALDLVDKTGQSMLQVAYSGEWQKSRYFRNLPLALIRPW
jgi:TIP41-like family.